MVEREYAAAQAVGKRCSGKGGGKRNDGGGEGGRQAQARRARREAKARSEAWREETTMNECLAR